MKDFVVELQGVSKQYKVYRKKSDMFRDLLLPGRGCGITQYALKEINLSFREGEIVGIIGCNGSGKSTLCKIIAQMLKPSSGTVNIKGGTYLLTPGAGMMDKLTGRENIHYKCLLMGYETQEITRMEQQIIDFAELEESIDLPLRTYSSGMRARLGFAISVQVQPDILIVDEALAVGDTGFHQKCKEKMKEFKEAGRTIFFISHSVDQMRNFCHKVVWLHNGQVVGVDEPDRMIHAYKEFVHRYTQMSTAEKQACFPVYEEE